MVALSNPGTYGTRKCSSWCAEIPQVEGSRRQAPRNSIFQKPKIKKKQKSKNPKKNARFRRCKSFRFLDFWIWDFQIFGFWDFGIFSVFGFLGFWVFGFFCVLHLCFQSVETAPKLDSEKKKRRLYRYLQCFKGCACRGGRVTICMYIYIYITRCRYRSRCRYRYVDIDPYLFMTAHNTEHLRNMAVASFPQTNASIRLRSTPTARPCLLSCPVRVAVTPKAEGAESAEPSMRKFCHTHPGWHTRLDKAKKRSRTSCHRSFHP